MLKHGFRGRGHCSSGRGSAGGHVAAAGWPVHMRSVHARSRASGQQVGTDFEVLTRGVRAWARHVSSHGWLATSTRTVGAGHAARCDSRDPPFAVMG